jgi:hypothetical protein
LRDIESGKMREGYIPFGAYWSTPFARWQGSFAHLHALKLGASTAKAELARRNIPPQAFEYAVLGTTIPQHGSFYGVPWVMGMIGNDRIGARPSAKPTLSDDRRNFLYEISMKFVGK